MCLSTVYMESKKPESVVMKNVMKIECKDEYVVLTDLMDRSVSIKGTLVCANLVDAFAIVKGEVA